jgi:hypothetical protein
MQVLIGRSFYYEKDDRIFVKGKSYSVNNKLANWIARKRLGEIIPVVSEDHKVKNLEKAPVDKMMKRNKAMRK